MSLSAKDQLWSEKHVNPRLGILPTSSDFAPGGAVVQYVDADHKKRDTSTNDSHDTTDSKVMVASNRHKGCLEVRGIQKQEWIIPRVVNAVRQRRAPTSARNPPTRSESRREQSRHVSCPPRRCRDAHLCGRRVSRLRRVARGVHSNASNCALIPRRDHAAAGNLHNHFPTTCP